MTPERILDWKTVLASPNGRRVIAQLIKEFGDSGDVFSPGAPDKTAYFAGRASATTVIRQHLTEVSPTLFYELQLERVREELLTKKSNKVEGSV